MSTLNLGDSFILDTDYSTSEVKTGATWIDGKPIYCRVINVPNITTGTTNVNTVVGVTGATKILRAWGTYHVNYNNGQVEWDSQFPYVLLGSHQVSINSIGAGYISIDSKFAATAVLSNIVVVVEYLKD